MENDNNQVNPGALTQLIVDMAVESWRFGKVFDRLLNKLDAGERSRYLSQFRWYLRKVEGSLAEAGMRMVNVEGHKFDPGIAATPLNIEDFQANDSLIVDQMLEPIIMRNGDLVRTGTILLRKVDL